jgi:hypothetical protein
MNKNVIKAKPSTHRFPGFVEYIAGGDLFVPQSWPKKQDGLGTVSTY